MKYSSLTSSAAFSTGCEWFEFDNLTISRPSTTRDIARALHLYRMKFAHRQLIVSLVLRSFTNFAPLTINERDPCFERTKQAAILKPKKSVQEEKFTNLVNFGSMSRSDLKHITSFSAREKK